MKKPVIAMKLHSGNVYPHFKMKLPEGSFGILFAFESKKAARAYWGKNVPMEEIEIENVKSNKITS